MAIFGHTSSGTVITAHQCKTATVHGHHDGGQIVILSSLEACATQTTTQQFALNHHSLSMMTCHAKKSHLMRSELIDQVVHVNEKNFKISDLLISLE